MKKIVYFIFTCIVASSMVSCLKSDDPYKEYAEWLAANELWYAAQDDLTEGSGNKFYTKVTATYDNEAKILMHWFNDRSKTAANISPKYTSTVDIKYIGRLYNDVAFDSSFLSTSPADSIYRTTMGGSIIDGWNIALMQMHIGDSCRVVIPYGLAYGPASIGDILPFSNLVFDIKLVDIPAYETKFSE